MDENVGGAGGAFSFGGVGHYALKVGHYALEVGNYVSSGGGIMLQAVDTNVGGTSHIVLGGKRKMNQNSRSFPFAYTYFFMGNSLDMKPSLGSLKN